MLMREYEALSPLLRRYWRLTFIPQMKRRFISNCLWQITQAEGRTKYDLRYRSRASLASPRDEWRHEHVFRRKDMVDSLLNFPHNSRKILTQAVGCVVTKSEHKVLSKIDRTNGDINGWDRYRVARIVVIDMEIGLPMQFDEQ